MKSLKLLFLLALLPAVAFGQTLTVSPGVVPPGHSIVAELTDLPILKTGQTRDIKWVYKEGIEKTGRKARVHLWGQPGDKEVSAVVTDFTPLIKRIIVPGPNYATDKSDHVVEDWVYSKSEEEHAYKATFKIEGTGPTPDPDPDVDPTPGPAPIPEAKLNVLVIEETDDRRNMAQTKEGFTKLVALQSVLWRQYVQSKGGEFRHIDKDSPMDNDLPKWQEAMKRSHPQLPWLVVSNGKAGYEGPFPDTLDQLITIIKKYAE
jgi:hypothetical protein